MTPRICKTCRLANWQLRKDGKPNPARVGRCQWVFQDPAVPQTMWREVSRAVEFGCRNIDYSDKTECRVWEGKDDDR